MNEPTLRGIRGRLAAIAPAPDPGTAQTADVARYLAVQSARELARRGTSCSLAALQALRALEFACSEPAFATLARARTAAREMAVALAGGDCGDWLEMHCAALSLDYGEITRLAGEEASLLAGHPFTALANEWEQDAASLAAEADRDDDEERAHRERAVAAAVGRCVRDLRDEITALRAVPGAEPDAAGPGAPRGGDGIPEAAEAVTEARIAAAVAAERERIRQLAIRTGAVVTGDEGTSCYFEALICDDTEGAVP